jgi:hypothetical protein
MILKKIITIIILPLFFIFINTSSVSSRATEFNGWINIETQKSYKSSASIDTSLNDTMGLQVVRQFHNIKSNITLNFFNNTDITFDQSFFEYKNKNKIFGVGKINRNWSFSPYTSIILSKNARPSDSVYFMIENKKKSKNSLLSWAGPSSFEVFNSKLSNSDGVKDAMLLGLRVVIEPANNLKFELVKTSQWGGSSYKENLSTFSNALIGNTNDSTNSNINQMAGIGVSFLTNTKKMPIRFYGQLIGEDEAGNLPSCFLSLIGSELKFKTNKLFSKIGFEYIDTRTKISENGFCGPNTAYNNSFYDYTNYGSSMGAPIDSEGKLLNLWASKKISEKLDIIYSVKNITINDTNWSGHRLNNIKQNGWITEIKPSWKLNSLIINMNLSYQGISLDKINIKDGLILGLSTKYTF